MYMKFYLNNPVYYLHFTFIFFLGSLEQPASYFHTWGNSYRWKTEIRCLVNWKSFGTWASSSYQVRRMLYPSRKSLRTILEVSNSSCYCKLGSVMILSFLCRVGWQSGLPDTLRDIFITKNLQSVSLARATCCDVKHHKNIFYFLLNINLSYRGGVVPLK